MLDLALDFFLVRKALARARSYSPVQRSRVALLSAAADDRARAARELRTRGVDAVRGALLRDALRFRAEAAGVGAHVLVRSALDEMGSMNVGDALASNDPLYFDSLDESVLTATIEALGAAERAARRNVEARSLAELRKARTVRVALLLGATASLVYVAAARLTAPPNVAFHKDVLVDGAPSRAASALVDGDTDRDGLPVVAAGVGASLTVDLAGVYVIDSVRTYNRRDGMMDASLPLALETSLDGRTWSTYDTLHDHFIVWDEKMHGTRARWVRLRTEGYSLGLLEIEVLGRYGK